MKYYKAPPAVARYLGVERQRSLFRDGNYLLWERDMMALGPSSDFGELIPAFGCREMTPSEVRAEQAGGEPCALPIPTHPEILALMRVDESDQSDQSDEDIVEPDNTEES